MKKWILLLGLLLSHLAYAFSENDLIAQLQQHQTVQGEFTQQRYLKALNKPITTSGHYVLVAQKGLLWQMEKPFANQLRVSPQGIMQWSGETWISNEKIGQGEQIRLFLGLFSGDIQQLKSQFQLELSGDSQQWQLRIVPNSLLMKQIFNQILIEGNQTPQSIILDETQGDRTEIRFNRTELNAPLSEFAKAALQ